MKLYWWHTVKIIACTMLILGSTHAPIKRAHAIKNITVFIHGTLLPGLALLNPYKAYTQTLETNDWYCKSLAKLRKNPLIYEDSIMLEEGLRKIDQPILLQYAQQTLTPDLSKKGAYQAIGAYHTLAKLVDNTGIDEYYTFGFSGILSDVHRKKAGHELYVRLSELIKQYEQEGYVPRITLCGYSHGGNVILYLADAENQIKNKVLIDTAIFFGTPIQMETAPYAAHPMFSKVVNIYSEGDTIQNNDSFSTASRASYRTFGDLFNTHRISTHQKNKIICDVRLLAHDNNSAFGHLVYWFFNKYPQPSSTSKSSTLPLAPLPLVILTPIFISLLETVWQQRVVTALDIAITTIDNGTYIKVIDGPRQATLAQSINLAEHLHKVQDYALRTWQPYTQSSDSAHIAIGLTAAFQTLTA
jgi:Protein of unknown function (DUF726)